MINKVTTSDHKVIAILQARMTSSRLPGKVLKPILGKPMLAHQIARVQQAENIDHLIIATSEHSSDDEIASLCQSLNIDCFRGSLTDVLDRYYQAANQYSATHVVRLTGDCPIIDHKIIDQVIALHLNSRFDYTANCEPPTLPDGLDVEVFTFKALEYAWQKSKKPSEREHVTPFIRNNPDLFMCQNYRYKEDLSYLRWTVDEPEDFDFITKVYQELYQHKPDFLLTDILLLLAQQPTLKNINKQFIRNEGLIKSIRADQRVAKTVTRQPNDEGKAS